MTRSSSPGGSSTRRVSIHVVSISTGDVPLSSKIRSLSPFQQTATFLDSSGPPRSRERAQFRSLFPRRSIRLGPGPASAQSQHWSAGRRFVAPDPGATLMTGVGPRSTRWRRRSRWRGLPSRAFPLCSRRRRGRNLAPWRSGLPVMQQRFQSLETNASTAPSSSPGAPRQLAALKVFRG